MPGPDPNPKILFIPFLRPGEIPVENTHPGLLSPQKFLNQNCGLGSGRLGTVPADPWPRGKITCPPLTLGGPFACRGGAVVALRAVDLPCLMEVWGRI